MQIRIDVSSNHDGLVHELYDEHNQKNDYKNADHQTHTVTARQEVVRSLGEKMDLIVIHLIEFTVDLVDREAVGAQFGPDNLVFEQDLDLFYFLGPHFRRLKIRGSKRVHHPRKRRGGKKKSQVNSNAKCNQWPAQLCHDSFLLSQMNDLIPQIKKK
jgi:hypothetical protein